MLVSTCVFPLSQSKLRKHFSFPMLLIGCWIFSVFFFLFFFLTYDVREEVGEWWDGWVESVCVKINRLTSFEQGTGRLISFTAPRHFANTSSLLLAEPVEQIHARHVKIARVVEVVGTSHGWNMYLQMWCANAPSSSFSPLVNPSWVLNR